MKEPASLEKNEFLKLVLARAGDGLGEAITGSLQDTVVSMFGHKMYAAPERLDDSLSPGYAAGVVFLQAPGSFRLRLAFDAPLVKTLVASIYPMDAANSEEILRDVVGEVSNVVAGNLTAFINEKGFDLSRELPVAETAAAGREGPAVLFGLNFSPFRNALAAANLLKVSLR